MVLPVSTTSLRATALQDFSDVSTQLDEADNTCRWPGLVPAQRQGKEKKNRLLMKNCHLAFQSLKFLSLTFQSFGILVNDISVIGLLGNLIK
jgi:hypothetical protein